MKRLFTLLLISMVALSCENVDEKLDDTSGKNDVIVFVEGTELTADVPSRQSVLNYKFASTLDWEVRTEADWLEIDPMSGKAGEDIKIQVKVKKNESGQSRTAYVDLIVANNDNYRITINQAGEGDDVVVEIPNNQIWYTSINGEVVEPYSGWFNDYADALTIFGANIVSNTYKNGQGVITFDRDVTTIGSFAFSGQDYDSVNQILVETSCIKLESIIIPDSVTTIGVQAFYECSSLTSVTIGDGVLEIYAAAFHICENLQEFKGKFASEDSRCLIVDGTLNSFAPAGLTEYTIPDSVTTIGSYAFYWCRSLTSVTIPDSVTSIGYDAFYGCSSLTSVTIPDSVTEIGDEAFEDCSSLQKFNGKFAFEDGRCLIVDGVLNSFAIGCGATEYIIPDSVTMIGNSAFAHCDSLTSVTIPDSVTTIGDHAFGFCNSLASVIIGDGVTLVDDSAFCLCTNLTNITIGNSVTEIGYQAFAGCESLTSVTLPDSVTLIEDAVFYSCSGLTSVTLSNNLTAISGWAFAHCGNLTSLTIPDSVTSIGIYAFYNCSSLTSVYCKAITPPVGGSSMFSNNASGRKIYVPMESVEAYKSASYWSDYADRIVAEEGAPEDMLISTIRYTTTDSTIVTPQNMNIKSNTYVDGEGVLEFYGDTIGCNAFSSCSSLTSVTIGDSVTTIEIYAFQGCSSLESITIPDSVTTIEHGAFDLCKSLNAVHITNLASWCNIDFINLFTDGMVDLSTNPLYYAHNIYLNGELVADLVIPDGVNEIKLMAFALCNSIKSVTIPNSVTTIGDYAFSSCSGLTSATIPNSVTTIGDYAFSSCSGLTSATIPNSVTTIGDYAFSSCSGLTSVTIPNSLTTLGDAVFRKCSNLTSITIPDSITTIGKSAFYECVSIKNIVIPNSVTSIGDFAFGSCSSLTSVTIPNSVTTLGDAVFRKCSSLTSVNIPNGVTTIRKSTFYECTSLANIVIPDSVTEIGEFAFAWCSNLTSVNIPYSVVSIGDAAFKSCNNLRMFSGKFASDGGKSLIIDNTLNAFAIGCGAIEYAIPNGVNMIGNSVFCNCESLTSVTIPDSITTIGELAFYGCSSLTSVYCKPTTPPSIVGELVFNNNGPDRIIYVPMGAVEAYKSARGWSDYADDIVGYNF